MLYRYEDIREVHLEISTKCNAMCPMCPRNIMGGRRNPNVLFTELTINDIRKIFPSKFVKQLKNLYMCGNYGEPATARDTLLAYKYLRGENSDMFLSMSTNGAVRTPEWWAQLAKTIDSKGSVYFAIDGLKETNHLYRRGTIWENIMNNAKAFIAAGGNARWEYIVFRHNEHQVEEAEKLSKKLGFKAFRIRKTGRFFNVKERTDTFPVIGIDGKVEYYLERPRRKIYQNKSLMAVGHLVAKYGSMENYYNNHAVIECKAQKEKGIYVSAEGLVFPCCRVSAQLYPWEFPPKSSQVWRLINKTGGIEKLNAKKKPIKAIIEKGLFSLIEKSWSKKDCRENKLKVCAVSCGVEFNRERDQFS